jgi:hypothetical protein
VVYDRIGFSPFRPFIANRRHRGRRSATRCACNVRVREINPVRKIASVSIDRDTRYAIRANPQVVTGRVEAAAVAAAVAAAAADE